MAPILSTEAISMISESSKYEHSILVSRIMSSLAEHFQTDKEEWVLAGLLHDLDYDEVDVDTNKHGLVAASMLEGKVSEGVLHAIMSHDHRTGVEPVNLLDKTLMFADAFAVLIEDQSLDHNSDEEEITEAISHEATKSHGSPRLSIVSV